MIMGEIFTPEVRAFKSYIGLKECSPMVWETGVQS